MYFRHPQTALFLCDSVFQKLRWPSWAPRPAYNLYGLCERKATLRTPTASFAFQEEKKRKNPESSAPSLFSFFILFYFFIIFCTKCFLEAADFL